MELILFTSRLLIDLRKLTQEGVAKSSCCSALSIVKNIMSDEVARLRMSVTQVRQSLRVSECSVQFCSPGEPECVQDVLAALSVYLSANSLIGLSIFELKSLQH